MAAQPRAVRTAGALAPLPPESAKAGMDGTLHKDKNRAQASHLAGLICQKSAPHLPCLGKTLRDVNMNLLDVNITWQSCSEPAYFSCFSCIHEKVHCATGQAGIPVWSGILYTSVYLYPSGYLVILSLRHREPLHLRAAKEIGPARCGRGRYHA
jgi:hypothetical protein